MPDTKIILKQVGTPSLPAQKWERRLRLSLLQKSRCNHLQKDNMQSKSDKLPNASCFIKLPSVLRRKELVVILFLICQTAFGQRWQSADSITVFRGTYDQTVALGKKGQIASCARNLYQLHLAEMLYAADNNDRFPKTWESMKSYVRSPSLLICPQSPYQPSSTYWDQFDFAQASYTPPEYGATFPNYTNTTCLYDDNHLLCDGRVVLKHPYALFPAATEGSLFTAYTVSGFPTKARQVVQCRANLRQLALCAKLYAVDNADSPAQSIQDLLSYGIGDRPEWLICPGSGRADYKMEIINMSSDPNTVYIHCLHHGTYVNAAYNTVLGSAAWEAPALIRSGPISQTASPGAEATLQVSSDYPNAALTFQWRREVPFDAAGQAFTNTQPIYGATNSSLILSNCQTTNEGYYSVVVNHSSGLTATSAMAFLRVER